MKLKSILGLVFSAALMVWIFSRYHIGDAVAYLERTDVSYLLPLPLFFIGSYAARAARWRTLFDKQEQPRLGTLLRALMVGHMMNNFLPARAGDVARIYLLGQRASISKSIVLATVVLEKVGDLIITACLISLVLVTLPASAWIRRAGYVLGMSSMAGVLIVLLVPVFGAQMLALFRRWFHFLPRNLYDRLSAIAENLISGIRSGTKLRGLMLFAAYSCVIWSMEILVMSAIARSLDVKLGLIPLLFVMLTIAVGTMIPAAPGALGTFEYFSLSALALVSVTSSVALAFTVLYHAALLLGTTVGGVFFMLLPGRERLLLMLRRGDTENPKPCKRCWLRWPHEPFPVGLTNRPTMRNIVEKIRRLLSLPVKLELVTFALWLIVVLALAWGTIPLLNPSARLFAIVKMLFYRDYIF